MSKKIYSFIFFIVLSCMLYAQDLHYILIENNIAEFYFIKSNNNIYELNEKAFIIIPKLNSGQQKVELINRKKITLTFNIEINNLDKGLKLQTNNNGDLFFEDINSAETTYSFEKPKTIGSEEAKKSITQPVENIGISNVEEQKPEIKQEPKKTKVKKIFSKENKNGIDNIYVTDTDTVAVFIPKIEMLKEKKITEVKVDSPKTEQSKNNVESINKSSKNCREYATETDIKNFSSTIISITTMSSKLKQAQGFLKAKCYNVNQLKRLSSLFINDNGKFSFFKLAQHSVSDKENFYQLETELKDTNTVEEFKAFVKQL